MKALVTGGAGFIGSHLVEYLARKGVKVKIFDATTDKKYFDFNLSSWDIVRGNIENYSEILQAADNCEVIFHLAGVLGTDFLVQRPKIAVQSNIFGTLNILDVARVTGSIVVYLSVLPNWNNSYMITKNAAAKFCQMYFQEFGVKTVILRGVHIYGERQKWKPIRKALPNFIVSALQNRPLGIYGNGNQLMDLLYVEDVVEAISRAAEVSMALGQTIELGSGIGVKVIDLAKKIIELCSSSSRLRFDGPRIGEPDTPAAFTPANIQQQVKILGFMPKISLDDGLIQTIEWYKRILFSANYSHSHTVEC